MARTGWHAIVLPLAGIVVAGCGRARASAEGRPDPLSAGFGAVAHAASAAAVETEGAARGGASATAELPSRAVEIDAVAGPSAGLQPVDASSAGLQPIDASSAGQGARGASGPCPDDMVLAGSACVDRYEAFLVQTGEAGAEAAWPHHQRPRAGVAYAARNAAGASPQAYINRHEAEAACERAGKRLCTLAEWQRACQGRRRATYPYGPAYQKGACNSGKPHLLSMFFGRDGNAWKYEEHFNSPLLDQQPGFLAKAGEYAACESDEGARDMVGNLHEWVSDLVDEARAPARGGPRRLTRPGNGIFMGGFFSTTSEHGEGCTFITTAHEPAYHDYSLGFRCCRGPSRR
jgi:sulfatase-modifying factor enzyme 1